MDIIKIREVAIGFLYQKPQADPNFKFLIAHHPFFSSNPVPYQNEKGEMELLDAFNEKEFQKWCEWKEKIINDCDIWKILMMMNSAYYMNFLLYIFMYFDDNTELGEVLKYTWTSQEFPNYNSKQYLDIIEKLFEKSRHRIMDKDERNKFHSLNEIVTVYRGQSHDGNYYKALSWTDNKERARWFSQRWCGCGKVWQAKIKRKDIYCYLNNRGESELIINPNKIFDRKQITE